MNFLKTATTIIFFSLGCFFIANVVQAQTATETKTSTEQITAYNTSLKLTKDGVLHVVEKINYDFGSNQKHGIFRDIPMNISDKPSSFLFDRFFAVKNVVILRDNKSETFTQSSENNILQFKIGNPDETLTGPHIYIISYDVFDAIMHPKTGGVVLNWNAVSDQWPVEVRNVGVSLAADPGILKSSVNCYEGVFGSVQNCIVKKVTSNAYEFIPNPSAGPAVTIEAELNPDVVNSQPLERIRTIWIVILGILTLLSGFSIWIYRLLNVNKIPKVIVAEYEPYEKVGPMYAGVLIDGKLNDSDIVAGVIYLAIEGFLSIEKIDKKIFGFDYGDDYKITLLKIVSETEMQFLTKVTQMLFKVQSVGVSVTLSELARDKGKSQNNYSLKWNLQKSLNEDLLSKGYFEKVPNLFTKLIAIVLVLNVFISFIIYYVNGFFQLGAIIVPMLFADIFFVVFLQAVFNRRRTKKGFIARNNLLGFKKFLSVTGTDRLAFHSNPRNNPDLFYEYLAYAVAFKVEKNWTEVFAGISMPSPDWYTGTSTGFNVASLTTSLGHFSSAFSKTSSSASSGGGSFSGSGGGVGGGGGGSW